MEIILAIATLIGGLSAIWFFFDKYKTQKIGASKLYTLNDLLKTHKKRISKDNEFSFVEILDELELSRMEVTLLKKIASFPDSGMPLSEIESLNNLVLEIEFQKAKNKLIKRGILIEEKKYNVLSFVHKNLKEYAELFPV